MDFNVTNKRRVDAIVFYGPTLNMMNNCITSKNQTWSPFWRWSLNHSISLKCSMEIEILICAQLALQVLGLIGCWKILWNQTILKHYNYYRVSMAERLQSSIQIHLAPFHVVSMPIVGSDLYDRKSPDWLSEGQWFHPQAWLSFLTDIRISRVTVHV